MKKYRNVNKGPLPVGLKSGSISVASRGYFSVDGEDLSSSDLLKKIRTGQVILIEETVVIHVLDDPEPVFVPTIIHEEEDKKELKKEIEQEVKKEIEKEALIEIEEDAARVDVGSDPKGDDTLTKIPKMLELSSEETESSKVSTLRKIKPKRRKKISKTKKKGFTG